MKDINENINFLEIDKQKKFIENYFDLKSFSKMFVSSLAWGEAQFHSMELNNSRFYINPFTLKIQPIPADYEFIFKIDGDGQHNPSDIIKFLNTLQHSNSNYY